MSTNVNLLIAAASQPELALPPPPPLTLTRNFGWIVGFCVGTLITAPLIIGWTASLLLR